MKSLTKLTVLSFLLLIAAFPQLAHLYLKDKNEATGQVAGLESQQETVTVRATVGEYYFTLFGYSSPGALISLNGQGISDETYADTTGYFEFKNRFSPF